MTFEPLPLFSNKREGVIFFAVLSLFFALHVSFIYTQYQNFSKHKFHNTQGVVEALYEKRNKNNQSYRVIRLKTKDFTIYTTSWKKRLGFSKNDTIKFTCITKNVTFLDFLAKRFFAPTFSYKRLHVKGSLNTSLAHHIAKQHKDKNLQELYLALFLAKPIGKELRQSVQNWGISHLIAISGYHLGVLSFGLFFLLSCFYKPLQDRFFPYRNSKVDIMILVFLCLGFYLYLIGFVPSFLRAFVMSLVGFFFYVRYIKIISFGNLAISAIFLLVLFPNLLLSIGFWFSVLGVFYIFLYLHHFRHSFSNLIHGALINIWVFLAMVIPVHGIFGYTSWQQFGAILLSFAFIPFYPLSIALHVINFGDILDPWLKVLFSFVLEGKNVIISLEFVACYLLLSIASIFNRYLAIFSILLGFIVFLS